MDVSRNDMISSTLLLRSALIKEAEESWSRILSMKETRCWTAAPVPGLPESWRHGEHPLRVTAVAVMLHNGGRAWALYVRMEMIRIRMVC